MILLGAWVRLYPAEAANLSTRRGDLLIPLIVVGNNPLFHRIKKFLLLKDPRRYVIKHIPLSAMNTPNPFADWKIGIVLVAEEDLGHVDDLLNNLPSGFTSAVLSHGGGFHAIAPYAKCSVIAASLQRIAAVTAWGKDRSHEDTDKVVFLSPVGGVGTSAAAKKYASEKAKRGRRILLLDLDPFQESRQYVSQAGGIVRDTQNTKHNSCVENEDDLRRGWQVFLYDLHREVATRTDDVARHGADIIEKTDDVHMPTNDVANRTNDVAQKAVDVATQTEDGYFVLEKDVDALDLLRLSSLDLQNVLIELESMHWDEIVVDDPMMQIAWTQMLLQWTNEVILCVDDRIDGVARTASFLSYLKRRALYDGEMYCTNIRLEEICKERSDSSQKGGGHWIETTR